MNILLKRIARKPTYTIGQMYIDGAYFCDTIEDTDRGLSQQLPASVNRAKKRQGVTAIPTGRYRVTLQVRSPRFATKQQYQFCRGYLPRLVNVPAFDGVLIHIGNTASDTEGCILVGKNKKVGRVLESAATFRALYERLKESTTDIFIDVV